MLGLLALVGAIVMLIVGILVIPLHTSQWQLWFFWSLALYFLSILLGHEVIEKRIRGR